MKTVVKARTLRVSKSVTPTQVQAGERVTYTIVFTNDSEISVDQVYITDTLPGGVTNVSLNTTDAAFNGQNGNAYSWISTTMPAGEVGTIEISFNAITSPVAADGRIYFTAEEGDIHVVKAGPVYEHMATNPMGEVCLATPAVSDGMIFVRTPHHLFGISE